MDDLRIIIRDLLSEELLKLRSDIAPIAPHTTEEAVAIRSSADLNGFVHRLLNMAQDGQVRADILEGRHRFCLSHDGTQPITAQSTPAQSITAQFTRGMVSERDVASLPEGTRSIKAAPPVRFTPLARDELRRRSIKIERTAA